MKCLLKYQWVKLPRSQMPQGKGIMNAWVRLASRAAFRNGQARYCRYINQVTIGTWAGGIVGLKSILGIKNRHKALELMDKLVQLGYIDYELNPKTKKLTYQIKDWVVQCSGEPCMGTEAVYATQGYGFLCLPRNITQRLAEAHYHFDEADAWLDLWCHTVWQEPGNAFSHMAPAVQFGKYGAVLTLETLGRRWGWEKTKVWRFFKKHADAFPLQKLPGSFGCLIFNTGYAHSFAFLCGRAGIPCLIQHSEDHQWNKVYVDGAWWDMDLTGSDPPDLGLRELIQLLYGPGELQGIDHLNTDPEITMFVQELLVPGSTK